MSETQNSFLNVFEDDASLLFFFLLLVLLFCGPYLGAFFGGGFDGDEGSSLLFFFLLLIILFGSGFGFSC
ncbi:hypothetical protein QBE52_06045 [Clostridiaceae bacterium 35-E11]